MKPYSMADAEADLRAAIDAGDQAKVEALGALVDELEAAERKPTATLHQAALWYAGVGLHVFPLRAGSKIPLAKCDRCKARDCPGPQECAHDLCHGLKDATTDAERVARWWTDMPNANIGLATGDGFDAVDIDGQPGQQSRVAHWADIFGAVDADNLAKVLTPRPGGMHIYVPPTGDGNAAGIVPGVDYRGVGGYVLAPPSVIAPGGKDHPGTYRFLGTPNLSKAS